MFFEFEIICQEQERRSDLASTHRRALTRSAAYSDSVLPASRMEDCKRFLNSRIAIRLEDDTKWIGVLSDIDLNGSVVVLEKGEAP